MLRKGSSAVKFQIKHTNNQCFGGKFQQWRAPTLPARPQASRIWTYPSENKYKMLWPGTSVGSPPSSLDICRTVRETSWPLADVEN